MRVAVFIKRTPFHKGFGGLETQNKLLCEGLVKKGHEVCVFSPQLDLKKTEESLNGVDYYFIPCVYRLSFSTVSKNNWINKSQALFQEHHSQKNFNVVLSQSSAGLGIIKNKKKLEVPVIGIAHGSILGEIRTRYQSIKSVKDFIKLIPDTLFVLRVFFGRQREFIHGCDKVIVVSSAVKKALIEETFAPEEKIEVIHNGVDAGPIAFTEFLERNAGILYIGQVDKTKGLADLFEVVKDARFNGIRLDIVGGGTYLDTLKRKIKANKLEDRVFVYGKLPYEEVLGFYRNPEVGIFVFPTRRVEGFPMVLPEAMFAGLPIVASNIGGVSDAVIDNETGFLVRSGDIQGLRAKILELIASSDLRKKMGENGRKKAYEKFSQDAMVAKYEKVMEGVLL